MAQFKLPIANGHDRLQQSLQLELGHLSVYRGGEHLFWFVWQ